MLDLEFSKVDRESLYNEKIKKIEEKIKNEYENKKMMTLKYEQKL